MHKHRILIFVVFLMAAAWAVSQARQPGQSDEAFLLARAAVWFRPVPTESDSWTASTSTSEQAALGRALFEDVRLAGEGDRSCAGCHRLTGGGAGSGVVIGHADQPGPRNIPPVFDVVLNRVFFWDGRAQDLASLDDGPIATGLLVDRTTSDVEATLLELPEYERAFARAYPDEVQPVTFANAVAAVEAFLGTLVTPGAPFDAFLRGDIAALSDDAQAGLKLFMDQGCVSCHNGVNIGGIGLHPFGVAARPSPAILPAEDFAAPDVPGRPSRLFRAPSLRNIGVTSPYFHSGIVTSLKGTVVLMEALQLGDPLTDEQANQMVAFLETLTAPPPRLVPSALP